MTGDIRFFHSFDWPEVIEGAASLEVLKQYSEVIFTGAPVAGRTVLDIGAWDGYYSFEAERRGASRVLATDHFCWSGPGPGTKAGFDYIHTALGSKVESLDVDVFDLDPARLGKFDIVLFLGVLYHLKNPFGGLEKAAAMTSDCLVVETHSAMNQITEPVMRYYLGAELNHDSTNFWGPNIKCVEAMLREVGFRQFQVFAYPAPANICRAIIHARH